LGFFFLFIITAACSGQSFQDGKPSSTPATKSMPLTTMTSTSDFPAGPTSSPGSSNDYASTPLPDELALDAAEWKSWPVQPVLTSRVPQIYQLGQELANDPHAFSIFGDCQSKPEVFLGLYDTDPAAISRLSPELQETVVNFTGSFNRESPTIKDATTAGGLLWPEWHGGLYGCSSEETPVTCELRIHRPSFVFINVGTHWVIRNQEYLRTIITQLVENGVVPILATKADDRYQGEKTNQDLATLAVEFDIPLWNFWAAALVLPDHGVYSKSGQWGLGDVYLSDEGLELYRLSALQALDSVWRAATGAQQ